MLSHFTCQTTVINEVDHLNMLNLSTNITGKFRANDFIFFWYMAGTDITKRGEAVHIVVIYTGGNRGTKIVQSPVE